MKHILNHPRTRPDSSMPDAASPPEGSDQTRTPRSILIVDDDASVRRALTDVLAAEGYAVTPAAGGIQALALAASSPVDLVLLDLNLLGQSGWDTFVEFTAAHPDTPIIVITARPEQEAHATRLRADALMEKPLNLPRLLEAVGRFLSESNAHRRRRRTHPAFKTWHLHARARRWPGPEGLSHRSIRSADPSPRLDPVGGRTRVPELKRILVVDDDASVREMLGRILAEEGYAVGEAADGAEAVDLAAKEVFHLVLLDLNLPVTCGWDAFERLTTRNPFVPVIVITARPHQVRTALATGVGALMEKPLDFPKLLHTIGVLLAESPWTHLARLTGRRPELYYLSPEQGGDWEDGRLARPLTDGEGI
jgi:DNA-binding response OmpR family regulator